MRNDKGRVKVIWKVIWMQSDSKVDKQCSNKVQNKANKRLSMINNLMQNEDSNLTLVSFFPCRWPSVTVVSIRMDLGNPGASPLHYTLITTCRCGDRNTEAYRQVGESVEESNQDGGRSGGV